MKSFATKTTDELGRIVLPMELRKKHQIETGTILEIGEDNGLIVLRKQLPYCKICGSTDNLVEITKKNFFICENCKRSVQEIA